MKSWKDIKAIAFLSLLLVVILLFVAWSERRARQNLQLLVKQQAVELAQLRKELSKPAAPTGPTGEVAAAQTSSQNSEFQTPPIAIQSAQSSIVAPMPTPMPVATSTERRADKADQAFRVNARLSAVEKFVSLSPEQREQLRQRFLADLQSETDSMSYVEGVDERDPLAEILGEENAAHYRSQVRNTFQRAQEEAQEKEILLYAKKLALDPEQEARFRDTVRGVDAELDANRRSKPRTRRLSMSERVQEIISENRQRNVLLQERLKAVFTAEQLAAYEQELARSSEQDFEMWHAPE